jgi:predicted CXXCH cytochrome family protein
MPGKSLKRLLISFGVILAAIIVLLVTMGLVVEAKFRPREQASITVPPDLGYLQGRLTASKGWLPLVLPGIVGAEVSLAPGGHKTTTHDDGFFAIPDIEPGLYTVSIAAAGFETGVIADVAIPGGRITTLPDEALFPEIKGPPKARLKVGTPAPFQKPAESHPYLTTVYIDASDSENISRRGIRFEIRNQEGTVLIDPYSADKTPLQLERSPNPGASPAVFLFTPPRPGTYRVKIILSNDKAPGVEDAAELTVRAVNIAPEAVPVVIAGPQPPQKTPTNAARASSGLNVVKKGANVYLMGLGLDRNHASPERYNPGGLDPDVYGKNNDHLQRQFSFQWELFHVDADTGARTPLHQSLRGPEQTPATRGQIIHFKADRPGRLEAMLEVADNDPSGSLTSAKASVSLVVVDDEEVQDGVACVACHEGQVDGYNRTAHKAASVGCESCHGPAAAHLSVAEGADGYEEKKRASQDASYSAGVCGQCHDEYPEWEKSRHSDGMPYGYHEIARPLLVQCSKCHYARTFKATLAAASEASVAFHEVQYKKRVAGIGPLMPDMSRVPEKDETAISCTACHSPHDAIKDKSAGLRTGDPGALCQTCHEEKWQNTVLEGSAGEVGNGFEYAGENYEAGNPHNTGSKCVLCHLGDQTGFVDAQGVRAVGGHTLRMRDTGPDKLLGGFGGKPDDDGQDKNPNDTDDVLHLAPCRVCHQGLNTFDRNGVQREVYARWVELGDLLKSANHGVLPGVQPGNKCATCHRGGTLPFGEDPKLVLENAYTNYKLIKNDRSWGIHNPPYVKKLLQDSITSVRAYLRTHGERRAAIYISSPSAFT